ncbi:hypothetical protein [Streptomyces sp. NPDC058294]
MTGATATTGAMAGPRDSCGRCHGEGRATAMTGATAMTPRYGRM